MIGSMTGPGETTSEEGRVWERAWEVHAQCTGVCVRMCVV